MDSFNCWNFANFVDKSGQMKMNLMIYFKKFGNTLLSDNDSIDSAITFTFGDVLATIVAFNLFQDFALPVVMSVTCGFLGGAVGILGKMFVKWIFKIKKEEKKKKK